MRKVLDIFVGPTPTNGPEISIGGVAFVSDPSELPKTPPPPLSDERLNLKLDDGTYLFTDIGPVFSTECKKLLSEIIDNDKSNFIKIAEKYEEDGREYFNFFYDIVFLINALQELPETFHSLTEIKGDAYILMHNSVLANLILEYRNKGHQVSLEPERNGSHPDLKIDDIFAEVKTIVSPKENTQKSFEDFAYAVNSKIDDEAKKQVGDNGMIFIAPWSGIVNSLYYTYYYQMKNDGIHNNLECDVHTELPAPMAGKTVIVTATPNVFEDYYLVFNTNDVSSNLNNFASTYYPIFSSKKYQMKYLSIIKPARNGFVVGNAGAKGISFRTG